MMSNQSLTFLQISDTHLGSDKDYKPSGLSPYERLEKAVATINSLNYDYDFVVHTGDVSGDKDFHSTKAHYQTALSLLSKIKKPIYYVVGNHDETPLLKEMLPTGEKEDLLQERDKLCYRFSRGRYTFLTLDVCIREKTPGLIPAEQLAILKKLLAEKDMQLTIFMHNPPFKLNSPWMDANMLISNGEELHALLAENQARVKGVFFGHIHQPLHLVRNGINYVAAPSTFHQFSISPRAVDITFDHANAQGFNVVTLTSDSTIVTRRAIL